MIGKVFFFFFGCSAAENKNQQATSVGGVQWIKKKNTTFFADWTLKSLEKKENTQNSDDLVVQIFFLYKFGI